MANPKSAYSVSTKKEKTDTKVKATISKLDESLNELETANLAEKSKKLASKYLDETKKSSEPDLEVTSKEKIKLSIAEKVKALQEKQKKEKTKKSKK